MPEPTLTKTDYLAYGQCTKRLWLEKHQSGLAAPPDPAARRRLLAGQEVDRLARQQFPGGRLIPYRPDLAEMVTLTQQAISDGHGTLFQATVAGRNLLVKADILTRIEGGWHLIEVKSSTSYKAEEHLPDVAFQVHVLREAGLKVTRASVMHLNSACCFPDLSQLFSLTDITADVETYLAQVATAVPLMIPLVLQEATPDQVIGRHCRKPYICPFHDHCWHSVSGRTIYDIPYLKRPVEAILEGQGILYVTDVPASYALGDKRAATFVETARRRQVAIDTNGIRVALKELEYPLYFLDFETIDYAVPVYDGCRPYQPLPFQFSCHILRADGRLEHVEYLHTSAGDPRQGLVDALLQHIGEDGHLVAYNASFEAGVLRHLAGQFPAHAGRLQGMANRLWDQLIIIRRHYRHHAFGGSNSLKAVLPVLVPKLDYNALAVRDGSQAQVAWEEMINCQDRSRRGELGDRLRAYCRLDTLAMVEIHKVLSAL
jgi:hypothetical protein